MRRDRPFCKLSGIMLAVLLSASWTGCSRSSMSLGKDAAASAALGGSGGVGGTGSGMGASGGMVGSGGSSTAAGTPGTGGIAESGGQPGSGGKASGGAVGDGTGGGGNTTATGGVAGGNGTISTGGATGKGGASARDGGQDVPSSTGGTGGSSGNTGATGGATGAGGSGGNMGATGGATGSGGGGNTGATGGATGLGGSTVCALPTVNLSGANAVANGPLITFNGSGSWFWFQDERAIVDVKGGKLVIGSVATPSGNIEAVIYDLKTGTSGGPTKLGNMSIDDHNAPAFVVRPDGGYAAMWAGHNQDCNSYFSVYDGTGWSEQKSYDWTPQGCPWSRTISYANPWYLGTDLISFVRSVGTNPNYLVSKDNGASFSYGGRLTSTPTVGYVAGYYKYWGNNTDRIDFVGTEAHPRDNNNSLYHGYIKDGKIYDSAGTVIDQTLADENGQNITSYTPVFKTGSTVGSVRLDHAWTADLVRYDDGVIAAIWTARVTGTGTDDPDKRLLYARYDGSSWKLTYLAKAGPKLYADEQDYTGLGALAPDDPTTLYISTPYNPSTDTMSTGSKREIWRGTTCDRGATFQWTPVTANSSKDNIRPIVPKWDAQHTALLWMQGSYQSASWVQTSIVGTITGP